MDPTQIFTDLKEILNADKEKLVRTGHDAKAMGIKRAIVLIEEYEKELKEGT